MKEKEEPINIVTKSEIYPVQESISMFIDGPLIIHTSKWHEGLETNPNLRFAYDKRLTCKCGLIHKDEDEKNGIYR